MFKLPSAAYVERFVAAFQKNPLGAVLLFAFVGLYSGSLIAILLLRWGW